MYLSQKSHVMLMERQVRAEIKRLLIKKSVLTEIFGNNIKHIACAVLFQYNLPSVRLLWIGVEQSPSVVNN